MGLVQCQHRCQSVEHSILTTHFNAMMNARTETLHRTYHNYIRRSTPHRAPHKGACLSTPKRETQTVKVVIAGEDVYF